MRRAEIRNFLDFLITPLIVRCRCVRCGRSAYRMRFVIPTRKAKTGPAPIVELTSIGKRQQRRYR